MTRRSSLLIAALIALLASPAFAQTPVPVPSYPFQATRDALLQDVDLTAHQREQVDSIAKAFLERMQAMDPVMRTKTRDEIRQNLRELAVEQAKDIRTILTDKQRQVFDKNYAAWVKRNGLDSESAAAKRSSGGGRSRRSQRDLNRVPG